MSDKAATRYNVGLFVTCLVDLFRPSVAFAAIKLLEQAGCRVSVPPTQTCCGQPAYNSGDRSAATDIVKQVVAAFEQFDAVVVPSGSCAGMIRHHGPLLLGDDPEWGARVKVLAEKTFELTQFLATKTAYTPTAQHTAEVVYHDSCSCLREMGIGAEPRALLDHVTGLNRREMDGREECCGFGGLFSVKYPDVSNAMVSAKVANIKASGAELCVGADLGCLLNIAGKLKRDGAPIAVRHVAEVLADHCDKPAIGDRS